MKSALRLRLVMIVLVSVALGNVAGLLTVSRAQSPRPGALTATVKVKALSSAASAQLQKQLAGIMTYADPGKGPGFTDPYTTATVAVSNSGKVLGLFGSKSTTFTLSIDTADPRAHADVAASIQQSLSGYLAWVGYPGAGPSQIANLAVQSVTVK